MFKLFLLANLFVTIAAQANVSIKNLSFPFAGSNPTSQDILDASKAIINEYRLTALTGQYELVDTRRSQISADIQEHFGEQNFTDFCPAKKVIEAYNTKSEKELEDLKLQVLSGWGVPLLRIIDANEARGQTITSLERITRLEPVSVSYSEDSYYQLKIKNSLMTIKWNFDSWSKSSKETHPSRNDANSVVCTYRKTM